MNMWNAWLQRQEQWFLRVAVLVEDIRGMSNPTGAKQAPAIIGGCAVCQIRGTRLPTVKGDKKKGTTYYPGAVCQCKDVEKKKVSKFYFLHTNYIYCITI
jgi:hypothetical protein